MSNKNMDWNQFLTEFVLRAMTNNIHEHYFSPSDAARRAREAWDAIQAAELPESEKAKQAPEPSFVPINAPAPIPSNSMELKRLAEKAILFSDGVAKFFAIDASGMVCAYSFLPVLNNGEWDLNDLSDDFWEIALVAPPANFRTELYEISKILNNEQ